MGRRLPPRAPGLGFCDASHDACHAAPRARPVLLTLRRHAARRAAFVAGARAVVPSLPAMAAWGVVTGIAMAKLGLGLATMLGLTFVVYSGTSQLAVLPLMAASTGVLAMVAAAAVANLRFVVYSAVLSRHLRRVPLALRLATGFVTIDGPLAALLQRQREGRLVQRVAFLNGANAITAAVWCGSSLLGIALAAALPFGPELAFVGVLALFGITVPMLVGRPAWAAAATSVAVALAGAGWPHRLGTFAAVLAGVAAALLAARLGRRDHAR
jgi:predicted branched-subunit amino acid permease